MVRYLNKNGDSPITYYNIGEDYIIVCFKSTIKAYTYSYSKAGKFHVENMKQHAINGAGLCAYITKHVKYLYDK